MVQCCQAKNKLNQRKMECQKCFCGYPVSLNQIYGYRSTVIHYILMIMTTHCVYHICFITPNTVHIFHLRLFTVIKHKSCYHEAWLYYDLLNPKCSLVALVKTLQLPLILKWLIWYMFLFSLYTKWKSTKESNMQYYIFSNLVYFYKLCADLYQPNKYERM